MMMEPSKRVEFRLIDDDEMPPLIVKRNEESLDPVIVINTHHRIWLSLHRTLIPGIAKSLSEKLNNLCDGYLREQIAFEDMGDGLD